MSIWLSLWSRFLLIGVFGKTVAVIVTLYAAGWAFATLGWDAAGRQFAAAAILVLGFLLTALFIRLIWGLSRKPGR